MQLCRQSLETEANNAVTSAAGNHTIIGLYDLPLLVYELYIRGYKVRGLAHPGHWNTPLGPIFESLGAVQASPMAAYRLLRKSEAVLLFPGGSREVGRNLFMLED